MPLYGEYSVAAVPRRMHRHRARPAPGSGRSRRRCAAADQRGRTPRPGARDAEVERRAGRVGDLAERDQGAVHRQVATGRYAQPLRRRRHRRIAGEVEIGVVGRIERRRRVTGRLEIQAQPRTLQPVGRAHVQVPRIAFLAIRRAVAERQHARVLHLHRPKPASEAVRAAMQVVAALVGGDPGGAGHQACTPHRRCGCRNARPGCRGRRDRRSRRARPPGRGPGGYDHARRGTPGSCGCRPGRGFPPTGRRLRPAARRGPGFRPPAGRMACFPSSGGSPPHRPQSGRGQDRRRFAARPMPPAAWQSRGMEWLRGHRHARPNGYAFQYRSEQQIHWKVMEPASMLDPFSPAGAAGREAPAQECMRLENRGWQ